MSIDRALIRDITDSEGASKLLSDRFGRSFSVDSVHQLVKKNKLRAFIFQSGILVERTPENHTRGKDLFFLFADLQNVPIPSRPGRPAVNIEPQTAQATLMARQKKIS